MGQGYFQTAMRTYWKIKKSHDDNSIQSRLHANTKKGRCIPVHLQQRVEGELNKLMDQNHIIKLDKCSDRQFISPIVITVKRIKQSNSR